MTDVSVTEWAREQRFYIARIDRNLFDEWIVTQRWGSVFRGITGEKQTYCETFEEAQDLLVAIDKRRVQRGYRVTCRLAASK